MGALSLVVGKKRVWVKMRLGEFSAAVEEKLQK